MILLSLKAPEEQDCMGFPCAALGCPTKEAILGCLNRIARTRGIATPPLPCSNFVVSSDSTHAAGAQTHVLFAALWVVNIGDKL